MAFTGNGIVVMLDYLQVLQLIHRSADIPGGRE